MPDTILNLTLHPATPEQRAAGVIDLPPALAAQVRERSGQNDSGGNP